MAEMKTYWLFGGMGGGFGGPNYLGDADCRSLEAAQDEAYALAVEDYESYAGLHGVQSYDEIRAEVIEEYPDLEECEIDQYAGEMYGEAIESWISYWAVEAIDSVDPEDYLEEHRSGPYD